ncbi:MAG: glycoside hydrolase family 16 protein [bacterium]|nr:glycoside hydrolase family 16 protein [bacterium]
MRLLPLYLALLACPGLVPPPAHASVLLHDDFSGPVLSTIWLQGTWILGRTQLGAPLAFSNDAGASFVSLPLHTFNPYYPGTRLWGAEIYSIENFARDEGLLAEARVRLRTETPGIVASFFAYRFLSNLADELDFEFLSNYPSNSLLLTQWNDWDYSGQNGSTYFNNTNHHSIMITNPLINRAQWTTLRFYWLPDGTIWEANGVELYRSALAQPDAPMPIRANFWAPDSAWQDAFSPALQPVTSLVQNTIFWYDIDRITVMQIPEPARLLATLAAWLMWKGARR